MLFGCMAIQYIEDVTSYLYHFVYDGLDKLCHDNIRILKHFRGLIMDLWYA